MKILLFGGTGQVGWELQRTLAPLGDLVVLGRDEADLEDLKRITGVITATTPDIIVNAAAYTAVDRAESEPEKSSRINAEAVAVLAKETKRVNGILVHYSSDYVFDGEKTEPYVETDVPNPLSIYGRTKLEGEQVIQSADCKHLIFRTGWVYATRGRNFVKTLLRLAQEKDELQVVDDQHGAPTNAGLIADVTAHVLRQILQKNGPHDIYHLTAAGKTSWCGFARHLIERAQSEGIPLCAKPENVKPITSGEYPTPARRPANSLLCTRKIRETFGIHLPEWQFHVDRVVAELSKLLKNE